MLKALFGHKLKEALLAFVCVCSFCMLSVSETAYAASSAQTTKSSASSAKKKATTAKKSTKSTAKKSTKTKKTAAKKSSTKKKTTAAKKTTAKKTTAKASTAKKVATASVAAAGAAAASAAVAQSEVSPDVAATIEDEMRLSAQKYSLDFFGELPKSRITAMRKAFVQATNAFKRGDEALGFKIHREQLKGYPLNIWLNYYYLSYNIRTEKFDAVMEFINSHEHEQLSALLKDRYADYLSEQRDYKRLSTLIGEKPFDDAAVSSLSFAQKAQMCRFYEANWPLNKVNEDAIRFATRVYLDLSKRPNSCNGLMALFDAKGYLTDKLILKRYETAYILRYYQDTTKSLSSSLAKTSFASRVKEQMELYDTPSDLFDKVKGNSEQEHRVAVLAFLRYANLSPAQARNDFAKFVKRYDPSEAELVDIYQIFASSFLGRSYTLADVEWVDKNLPTVAWNDSLVEQRLRRAIYFAQWDKVYVLIDHLPADARADINWRYWKGRSAYELGKSDEANTILAEVAKDRSFFGFYAAQSQKLDYPFNYQKLDEKFNFPMDIATNKSAIRFLELYALDDDNAIFEWREMSQRSSDREAMIMAQWALQTGNIRYAIDFVVSSQRWDALDYRFPIAYRNLYEQHSKESGVPLSYLYGISRQESMLNHEIKSPVGAVGLMQVMPGTARDIARKEKWQFEGVKNLTDPNTNIRYGSTYLNWMLSKFDNNRVLASAAYNAGPGRIPRWRSNDGIYRDAAMYIECIPFAETRKYVQNVLLYDSIYNYLLTGKKGHLMNPSELSYAY